MFCEPIELKLWDLRLARRDPSHRYVRRWKLLARKISRPTSRECESRRLIWMLACAKGADDEQRSKESKVIMDNHIALIHRSMLMAREAVETGDQGLAQLHIRCGLDRWQSCDLPLYGKSTADSHKND